MSLETGIGTEMGTEMGTGVETEMGTEIGTEKSCTKSNTDPKPHICYLNSDSSTLGELFLKKIKPMEGIVKYKMVGWNEFPTNLENAKLLSKSWAEKFHTSNLYNEFMIGIYFHLEKKTIRFELKLKKSNYVNLCEDGDGGKVGDGGECEDGGKVGDGVECEDGGKVGDGVECEDNVNMVEEKILSYEYSSKSSVIFACDKTNYFNTYNLDMCKNTGKRLSEELEIKYPHNKFVVFLNQAKKTIQITTK